MMRLSEPLLNLYSQHKQLEAHTGELPQTATAPNGEWNSIQSVSPERYAHG